jgi:hypothetical protein
MLPLQTQESYFLTFHPYLIRKPGGIVSEALSEPNPFNVSVGDTCKEIGVLRHSSDDADEVPKA